MTRVRRFGLIAVILTLTTAVALNTSPPLSAAAMAGSHAVATVIGDPECPPNSDDTFPTSARRCIAELVRSTRSGLQPDCLTAPKALQLNPLYAKTECHGGRGVQAEAIAQARAIARLNAGGVYGDHGPTGGITANLQWEVGYSSGRIDVLRYNRDEPNSPIELIDLKGVWGGGSASASSQLDRYVRDLPPGMNDRVVRRSVFPSGYPEDAYRVLVSSCEEAGTRNRIINQYKVAPTLALGVLEITGPAQEVTPCVGQGEPVEIPIEEAVPEHVPDQVQDPHQPLIFPAPGRDSDDDGHDDFWDSFLQEHPELNDLPVWPALPPVPVPDDQTVVLTFDAGQLIATLLVECMANKDCADTLSTVAGAVKLAGVVSQVETQTLVDFLSDLLYQMNKNSDLGRPPHGYARLAHVRLPGGRGVPSLRDTQRER